MNLRQVRVLLGKEFFSGPKSFLFVFAFVAPVVISLLISLIFGTLFTHEPALGFVDEGGSSLVPMLQEQTAIEVREYESVPDLRSAVAEGQVDGGIVLRDGFDAALQEQGSVEIPLYIWGESLAKDRTILTATVKTMIRELAGQETPVDVKVVPLGDRENVPWSDRLLPLVVLMTVFIAGFVLPAISLLSEKEKKTIDALMVTPTTVGQIFWTKGILGITIGVFMGIVILAMNRALGEQPGLLLMLLFLGSIMAATLGLILSSIVNSIPAFFGTMKLVNIFLFAPALLYLFPEIPEWIGKIFPTYYIIDPIVEISQRGGGWPEISVNVFILLGLNLVFIALLGLLIRRRRQYAV